MKRILFIFALAMSLFQVKAQEANLQLVSSAGNSYQNENYQIDWSIGEIAVETLTGASITLTQGFHQGSLEVSTLISNTDFDIDMQVYPNPTSSYIKLTTETNSTELFVSIIAMNGGKIYSGKLNSCNWIFDLSDYASGTYILAVNDKNRTLKSFKIIKQ